MSIKRYFNAGVFIPLSMFVAEPGDWPSSVTIRIGKEGCKEGPIFRGKVAKTVEERSTGLGGRYERLRPDEAMVFVWKEKADGSFFWMKETYIPLSLLYFDKKGKLLTTYEMPVEADPSHPKALYFKPDEAVVGVEMAPGNASRFASSSSSSFTLCLQSDSIAKSKELKH